jgi:D-ribulokinase
MADFHRTKRKVHGLMRRLDSESRDAMRAVALRAGLDTKNS